MERFFSQICQSAIKPGGGESPSDNLENDVTQNAPTTTSGNWTTSGRYATSFAGGSGTEDDPYLIETPQQLAYLAYLINNSMSYSTYRSLFYEQTANIDLSAYYWVAIGYLSSSRSFGGYYNGGGYTISGLYTTSSSSYTYQGLFGYVSSSWRIENVNIGADSYVRGYEYAGAIAGCIKYGQITNCSNNGTVTASDYAGGIVGCAERPSSAHEISNCYNTGDVSSDVRAAGIVAITERFVSDCWNSGNITSDDYAGGITVQAESGAERCYNTGTVSGGIQAGGIVGNFTTYYTDHYDLRDCYNTGDISGGNYVGGIAAVYGNYRYTGGIFYCYNKGNVTSNVSRGYAGGIVGRSSINYDYSNYIYRCYNAGNVSAQSGDDYQGGIIGYVYSTDYNYYVYIQYCYWGVDCTLTSYIGDWYRYVPVTEQCSRITNEEDVKSLDWYTTSSNWDGYTWDFEETWGFVDGVNDGYPVLVNVITTHTVSYNANGGSGTMDDSLKVLGSDLTLRTNTFRRTGYTFEGWATSSNGSVVYEDGGVYSDDADITLYAVWERATYTNYYRYRNTNGSTASSSQTRTYGLSFTLRSSTYYSYYTSNGWNMIGWTRTSNATDSTYNPGQSITSTSTSTLYYYAISERSISINYDANGGSFSSTPTTAGIQRWNQYNNVITTENLTLTTTEPTRVGFEFLGWATSANAIQAAYNPGANYTFSNAYNVSASVTLYAVWQANNPAHYDSEGGYWYVENGYMPQERVTNTTTSTYLSTNWNSLSNGSVYYMDGIGNMQSKVYNGNEYCEYNGNYYLVQPIKWRLTYSSSQQTGYGTTTDTLAVMDTIVYVGRYSESTINEGQGYSSTAVDGLNNNQIDEYYLVEWTESMPTFGTTLLYGTPDEVTSNIFVSSMEEIESVAGDYSVKFSDLVSDYLADTGAGMFYYTRNLGTNQNNIVCLSIDGAVTQRKPNLNLLGVQFTITVSEYACV